MLIQFAVRTFGPIFLRGGLGGGATTDAAASQSSDDDFDDFDDDNGAGTSNDNGIKLDLPIFTPEIGEIKNDGVESSTDVSALKVILEPSQKDLVD